MSAIRSLHVVVEDDYPPFGFILPDGSLAGFNVDLARALCDELKISCTVQPRRWDTILPAIEAGRADAAIASISISAQNRARVDFTAPYYKTPARFVAARRSEITDALPETLAGKTIGVEAHTSHEAYLKQFFPRAVLHLYETQTALRIALRSGEIEIAFGDGVAMAVWLNGVDSANCCEFRGGPFLHSGYFGEGVGIAVRKNNAAVRRALDFALRSVAERGVYSDLYLRYFPIGFF